MEKFFLESLAEKIESLVYEEYIITTLNIPIKVIKEEIYSLL